jgi:hypothetical protein
MHTRTCRKPPHVILSGSLSARGVMSSALHHLPMSDGHMLKIMNELEKNQARGSTRLAHDVHTQLNRKPVSTSRSHPLPYRLCAYCTVAPPNKPCAFTNQVFRGPPLTMQDQSTLQKANEFETLMVNQNRVAAGLLLAAILLAAYLHVPASPHAHVRAYTAMCPHVSIKLGIC